MVTRLLANFDIRQLLVGLFIVVEIDCLLSAAINQKRPYLCEIQCSYNKRSDANLHKYLTSTSRNDTAVAYGANEMQNAFLFHFRNDSRQEKVYVIGKY